MSARPSLSVLIVEDTPADAELLLRELRAGGDVDGMVAADVTSMRHALASRRFDAVVCDWAMPSFGALPALRIVKEHDPNLPFLVVSGAVGEEMAVDAMRAGADDIVLKDRLSRLRPALDRSIHEAGERRARRVAEDEVRKQQHRFRAMFDKSAEVVSLSGPDGKLQYVSESIRTILGYEPSELLGKSLLETVHAADRERLTAASRSIFAGEVQTFVVEMRALHRDGSTRWMEATATNLLADPDIRAVVGNFRDVTERKRAADALAASEERYRTLIDAMSDGLLESDGLFRTTFVNERMAEMLGMSRERMIGRSTLDFLHPDELAKTAERVDRRAKGIGEQVEIRFLRADGSDLWALVDVKPRFGANREFAGTLAVVMDITERRRTEQALRSSEARFRRLSEAGLIGIGTANLDGVILESNETMARILGYTADELRRMNWAEMTPPEFAESDRRALTQLRSTGVSPLWEKELFHKDGHRVPILIGVAMLDPATALSFLLDLSEKRKAEAALRDKEEQLRQSQKMESIGRLAGGVAHDFNNLLSVILSYCDFLRKDFPPDHPRVEDLSEIQAAGERAVGLTRQLLAFSRRQVMQPRVLDLNHVVTGMTRLLERLLGDDIELEAICSPNSGPVFADRGQLEQVLMNLAVNARDAMPRGGRITIRTSRRIVDEEWAAGREIRPGEYAAIDVTDTGAGMEPAVLKRIFEPFFTTKEIGRGTGLGLSTVFGIARQSGGTVDVASEIGKGSSFTLLLPISDKTASPSAATSKAAAIGPQTILLVEDDDAVRTLTRRVLTGQGHDVLSAASAEEALRLAADRGKHIDLLLTDVVMPHMDGRELSERLIALRPDLRVLFMSGYTDDEVLRHGVETSGISFLEKPIEPERLIEKIREVFAGPRPSR